MIFHIGQFFIAIIISYNIQHIAVAAIISAMVHSSSYRTCWVNFMSCFYQCFKYPCSHVAVPCIHSSFSMLHINMEG